MISSINKFPPFTLSASLDCDLICGYGEEDVMLLKNSGGSDARDPFVFYHKGQFYHCFSKGPGCLWVACAREARGLLEAAPVCVYQAEPGKPYSCELWAPELHVMTEIIITTACTS